jgi:hypothetical protein
MKTKSKIPGAALFGGAIELSALPTMESEGKWNVLAYEVNLPGHGENGARLTRSDFEQMIANFARYPKVPVVIEHADTDWFGDTEWREPHGWVTELRISTYKRPDGREVASLDGRLSLREETALEVNGDAKNPPKWPFGSITCFQGIDTETEKSLGMCLWSFSLCAHPALIDAPKLAASAHGPRPATAEQLAEIFGGTPGQYAALFEPGGPLHIVRVGNDDDSNPPPSTSIGAAEKEPTPMTMKLIALAATLGFAAKDESEAEAAVTALATEAVDVRRVLVTKSPAETAAKLAQLSADAATVPALRTKVALFEKAANEKIAAERDALVSDIVLGMGLPEDLQEGVKASLALHAKTDWDGFQKAHARPSEEELSQRRQDSKRLNRALPATRQTAPASVGDGEVGSDEIILATNAIVEEMRGQGVEVSFSEALEMLTTHTGPVVAELEPESAGE